MGQTETYPHEETHNNPQRKTGIYLLLQNCIKYVKSKLLSILSGGIDIF